MLTLSTAGRVKPIRYDYLMIQPMGRAVRPYSRKC
jgi:hypothetical protein